MHDRRLSAFTLIELLVTITVIAIMAVVVVLTINPAQLLAQSRDANRVSDAAALNGALRFYQSDQLDATTFTMGNASSVYVSLVDTTSTCANLGLPALPAGYTYACASSASSTNINGTGWIPVNLAGVSTGAAPFSDLPVDVKNTSSSGLYYTYSTYNNQFIVTATPESQKLKAALAIDPSIPNYPGVIANGTDFTISPLYSSTGLAAYWPMDEGSGSSTLDVSGHGSNGVWAGATVGTNGTYYKAGKVGSGAGAFDGTTAYITGAGLPLPPASTTITQSAWVNPATAAGGFVFNQGRSGTCFGYGINFGAANNVFFNNSPGSFPFGANATSGVWSHVVLVSNATGTTAYINGVNRGNTPHATSACTWGSWTIGTRAFNSISANFNGLIDDVRIYTRELSPAEIQALYNAEK